MVFERGARFVLGDPHPTVFTEGFAAGALGDRLLRRQLLNRRWRLLGVEALEELDKRGQRDLARECEAVFYDYTGNRTLHVTGPAGGGGPFTLRESNAQPTSTSAEFQEAAALVAAHPLWGPMLQAKAVRTYEPMPPILQPLGDQRVERTIYVGLFSRERKFNRIVPVNMVRYAAGNEAVLPRGARVTDTACGLPDANCSRPAPGTPGRVTIEWPARDPVWKFQAIRPSATRTKRTPNGTAIELRNVRYKGKTVLKQAHIPILNVKYEQDLCGPFRDWTYDETCFEAIGEDIPGAPGFRWCAQAPRTILESGSDTGSFNGVAVHEAKDGSLQLISELWAGWYRYIVEWRFYRDGRIGPRMRFGAVENSCVCKTHNHHVYWRFDFDIAGTRNNVEEQVAGVWTPLKRETARLRLPGGGPLWRVISERKGTGYQILPGPNDSIGDEFSGPDLYALKYRNTELDDHHHTIVEAQADLLKFVNNEKIARTDVVVWYHAVFRHDVTEEGDFHAEELGPDLVPLNWPS